MGEVFTKEQIIEASGLHPLKVRAIYRYGSRVYGSAQPFSDYDFVVVGSNQLEHEEKKVSIGDALLNIQIITHDKFKRDLENHDILPLECVFLPEEHVIFQKVAAEFTLNKKKLAKSLLNESFVTWRNAKLKLEQRDIKRGLKKVFHSIRVLYFALQIAEHGKIIDYSEANYIFDEIQLCDEFDWDYFKEKYLPLKKELEDKLIEICK